MANKYSIASGIALAMNREGAELAFTYQNERLLKNLKPIAEQCNSDILLECDVSDDNSIAATFKQLSSKWKKFDGFVHSIGYAPADQLEGDFLKLLIVKDLRLLMILVHIVLQQWLKRLNQCSMKTLLF